MYLGVTKQRDNYLFTICIALSLIALIAFGKKDFFTLEIFLILPLLYSYIRNNKLLSIVISSFLIFVNNYLFGINIYILLIEYFFYFIYYLKTYSSKSFDFINKFILIRSFFLSFYLFNIYSKISFDVGILYLIVAIAVMYLLSLGYYYLLKNQINVLEMEKIKRELDNHDNRQNYLYALTHELKNSLTISKGYLDMLNRCRNDLKKNEYLKIISQEVNRSIIMIQNGLNMSKDDMNYEVLDINLLLEDVSYTLKELFKKKKIKYRVKYVDDDIYLLGDYEKLKQVFINILKNSVESREKNLSIVIDCGIEKNTVHISIQDNGCGIDDISLLGNNYTNKCEGMGIGTYLIKDIINKHNGKIIYESGVNSGTTVNIFLPLFK